MMGRVVGFLFVVLVVGGGLVPAWGARAQTKAEEVKNAVHTMMVGRHFEIDNISRCGRSRGKTLCRQILRALASGNFQVVEPIESSDTEANLTRYQEILKSCGGELRPYKMMYPQPFPRDAPDPVPAPQPTRGFALYEYPHEATGGRSVYVYRSEDWAGPDGNIVVAGVMIPFLFPGCQGGQGMGIDKKFPDPKGEGQWLAAPIIALGIPLLLNISAWNGEHKGYMITIMGVEHRVDTVPSVDFFTDLRELSK